LKQKRRSNSVKFPQGAPKSSNFEHFEHFELHLQWLTVTYSVQWRSATKLPQTKKYGV
jgi:hypothetical protein